MRLKLRRARLLNAAAGDWEKKLERAMCFLRVVCSARDSIESKRYLAPRTRKIPKSTKMFDRLLHLYGPNEFRQISRINRENFVSMTRLIEHHLVFHTANESGAQQRPCWRKLALTLERLGWDGTGAYVGRFARTFGVGNGTTNRVVEALYDHVSEFIRWPDVQEREMISLRMAEHGFPGCIGFVDGTDVILAHRPKKDGETFFNRKKRYAYNIQLVCDDRKAIRLLAWFLGGFNHMKKLTAINIAMAILFSRAVCLGRQRLCCKQTHPPSVLSSRCLMACELTLQRACRGKGAHRTRQRHSL
ncbi:hypothetical protein PsorP6_001152 [Peronosclerospora sorghi]|uniref:Uncharacterized protein n=1 Tax=Peronosclerospora sorghi TaxID=230839 RepID=A0ACC0WXH0_9STRA|nr:hypothetical protein PsorP6_001152 [Peronosclerospora sorghi]